MTEPIRIANCSGFYGDRLSGAREMVEGGPIDYLMLDYLAEVTMSIMQKQRSRNPFDRVAVLSHQRPRRAAQPRLKLEQLCLAEQAPDLEDVIEITAPA